MSFQDPSTPCSGGSFKNGQSPAPAVACQGRGSGRDIKPEVAGPMHAVASWKQAQFVQAQRAVLAVALERTWFGPGDVEYGLNPEDMQGVASNAWNSLRALGIVERAPMDLTDPASGIFGGRVRNKAECAKGRWTAVYRLKSRPLAKAWLERHGYPVRAQQQELPL